MKRLLSILIYIIALFVLQELFFRAFFPVPEIKNFNRINYTQSGNSRENKVRPIRNIGLVVSSAPDKAEFTLNLNLYGFRDKNWAIQKSDTKKRILFVGDSFVEGFMAPDDEVIPKGFEKEAGISKTEVDALNLGISGTSLKQYMQLIVDVTKTFKPDSIFLILYANDFVFQSLPVFKKEISFNFLPDYTNYLTPRIMEIFSEISSGELIAFRYNLEKVNFFPVVPDKNNIWSARESELKDHVTFDVLSAMKKGKFNPNSVNELLFNEAYLKIPVNIESELHFLKKYIEAFGTKLFVVYIPTKNQVSAYYNKFDKKSCLIFCKNNEMDLTKEKYQIHRKHLAETCTKLNIPFCDLSPAIMKEEGKGNHLYWDFDKHLKGHSNLLIGQILFDWWQKVR